MQLFSTFNGRMTRIAGSLALVLAIALSAVAFANSNNPTVLPVEPDGGIGGAVAEDLPLPVEPDGGIGGEVPVDLPLPVEPDGGIGDTPVDLPLPVEPDGGIGN